MKILNLVLVLMSLSASISYAQSEQGFDPYNKVQRMENFFRGQGYNFNTISGGYAQTKYYEFDWLPRKIPLNSTNKKDTVESHNEVLAKQKNDQVCARLSESDSDNWQFVCFVNMVKQ